MIATLAGGCFWCTEAIFKRLIGVKSVVPGYTGGDVVNPSYDQVCSGKTGHAEAIQIEFDPELVPFEVILDIFFHTHNPTTLNQQGNDIGTQYRSAIFYHDEAQRAVAERVLAAAQLEPAFGGKIVTEIVPASVFYVAENYHHDYFERNSSQSYCDFVITPKIHKLLERYGERVKVEFK
jgi:peptide-methionine (S)-S-oxide reductase